MTASQLVFVLALTLGGASLSCPDSAPPVTPAEDGGAEEDGGMASEDGGVVVDAGPPPPLGVTPVDNLYIFPRRGDGGLTGSSFLASEISRNRANGSVDCVFYILTDNTIEQAILTAKRNGVNVRVLLDSAPTPGGTGDPNGDAKRLFTQNNVLWKNGPARFTNYHQKSCVIDNRRAFVMTLNPSAAGFSDNREYAVTVSRRAELDDMNRLFDADWNNAAEPSATSALVVSPQNARDRLTRLIRKGSSDLLLTLETFTDSGIRAALIERKNAGARIRVVLAHPTDVDQNADTAMVLRSYGFEVRFLRRPTMHAKLIVADTVMAYVGSINMTPTSIERNREVGVLIDQAAIVGQLKAQAEADWTAGTVNP